MNNDFFDILHPPVLALKRNVKRVRGMETFYVIDSIWFPAHMYAKINTGEAKIIGIVKVYDTITHEYKYYIGQATGLDIETDEDLIVGTGVPFIPESYETLQILFKLQSNK